MSLVTSGAIQRLKTACENFRAADAQAIRVLRLAVPPGTKTTWSSAGQATVVEVVAIDGAELSSAEVVVQMPTGAQKRVSAKRFIQHLR